MKSIIKIYIAYTFMTLMRDCGISLNKLQSHNQEHIVFIDEGELIYLYSYSENESCASYQESDSEY